MFIPIRSDRPLRATPYVNYALIAINIVVFGVTYNLLRSDEPTFVRDLLLNKWLYSTPESGVIVTKIWQFITYQFLHGSPMHLIGNLIFLWVFGNAVEDRLGKVGYLFFYLAMGVLAGLGHWLTSDASVLGASGSIAGVTGAYLALFPRTRITFLYFFFLIGAFEVPAMVVVLFYFVKDLFFFGAGLGGGVAYTAHLAGNLAGFAVGMALLGPRLLPREPYDLFSLWTHKRRRDKFKKIVKQGQQAWEHSAAGPANDKPLTPEQQAVIDQRQAVSRAIGNHDMDQAARLYLELNQKHGDQALSQRQQFELANHLAGLGHHADAAKAYELLLRTYPRHDDRAHAQLMLGLINARYLGKPNDAKPLLQEASQRLQGDDAALARQLLAEVS
jgi:membrane associated rhomboid family serine protease